VLWKHCSTWFRLVMHNMLKLLRKLTNLCFITLPQFAQLLQNG
jgi:hypothetical protein